MLLRGAALLAAALLLLVALPRAVHAQPGGSADTIRVDTGAMLTSAERWRYFGDRVLSWRLPASAFASGTVAHLRDDPAGWDQDALGYGARVASGTGSWLLYLSAEHALAAALDADVRDYQPIEEGSFWRRTGHALRAGVTVRTAGGGRLPALPQVGGALASSLAQNQWETGALRPGEAALATVATLGFESLANVLVEFIR